MDSPALLKKYSAFDSSSAKTYWYWADFAAKVGVLEFERSNPQFQVTIKRFNNYNPKNRYDCGYSMEAVKSISEDHPDVVAIFGDYIPRTTLYTAAMASYFKIPFCSPMAYSTTMLDRHKYGYAMQLLNMSGNGQALVNLLQLWNVKKVALVCGSTLGTMCEDFKIHLQENKILILANLDADILYTPEGVEYIGKTLQRVDARYIILNGALNTVNSIYFELASKKIAFGPGYVWLGAYPFPTQETFDKCGEKCYELLKGFISFWGQPMASDASQQKQHEYVDDVQTLASLPDYYGAASEVNFASSFFKAIVSGSDGYRKVSSAVRPFLSVRKNTVLSARGSESVGGTSHTEEETEGGSRIVESTTSKMGTETARTVGDRKKTGRVPANKQTVKGFSVSYQIKGKWKMDTVWEKAMAVLQMSRGRLILLLITKEKFGLWSESLPKSTTVSIGMVSVGNVEQTRVVIEFLKGKDQKLVIWMDFEKVALGEEFEQQLTQKISEIHH
ncbi:UNVERIFIED_CONTAM: hypothetical protein HDU68_011442 [Siphonaria sp. JEL0065]|nr:hypothetical protein HDU68_011442 [Siphonaria sp. JEL0065]